MESGAPWAAATAANPPPFPNALSRCGNWGATGRLSARAIRLTQASAGSHSPGRCQIGVGQYAMRAPSLPRCIAYQGQS